MGKDYGKKYKTPKNKKKDKKKVKEPEPEPEPPKRKKRRKQFKNQPVTLKKIVGALLTHIDDLDFFFFFPQQEKVPVFSTSENSF